MSRYRICLAAVVSLFTLRAAPALGFSETSLMAPAAPIENQAPVIEEEKAVDAETTPAPVPRPPLASQMDWPMPGFSLGVLLGQSNFSSAGYATFAFSDYLTGLFGWMIDTGESSLGQRLTHGPVLEGELALPNITTITPFVAAGPGFFFSRRTEVETDDPEIAQENATGLGFVGRVGISLFLTKHFSLLMQQSYLVLEKGLTTDDHKQEKTIARSQMMFQFTF